MRLYGTVAIAVACATVAVAVSAQVIPADSACKPIAQRTRDLGCWIIVDAPVGRLDRASTNWHLDTYPTRAAAEAGASYSAMYMEAISSPGMTSATHTHSGPEAWYTVAGAMCLETPDGAMIGSAGAAAETVAQTPPKAVLPFAPDDLQAFVRAAIADRLRANDIPDGNLLQSHRIGVRDAMPQAHLALKEAALPEIEGYQLFLLSPADAQGEADRRKVTIPFIIVDEPAVTGDTGSLWLGTDTAIPRQSGLIKLCCCTGKAEFRRSGHSWAFVKWSAMVCS